MARRKWTKEKLQEELIKIYTLEKQGHSITLYKDFPQVYHSCFRLHGSVADALEYANIALDDVNFIKKNKNTKWEFDDIKSGLLELLAKERRGEKFNFTKYYQKLKQACRRNYGTVENAAKYFNLDKKLKFIRGENK